MLANNRAMTFSFLKSAYPWFIVCCGMSFYCFNYFLRVSPSVMQNDLTHAFNIDAYQFGALAAFYYYAYTPMQIPAGMLYDKFGVRIVLCIACLLAALGLGVFVSANDFWTAATGRFMIGLGSAFAYIGTLKLASIWLPPNRFATIAGITTAVGMISGALAQKYLIHVVQLIGYKQALHTALIAGIILSVTIFILVKNRPKAPAYSANEMQNPLNLKQLLGALKIIFTNPQMWIIGLIGCLLYLPSSVFLDLWGLDYLKAVYNFTPEQAVSVLNCTSYGWIVSGPIIGALSDKIQRRLMPLLITGLFAAILLSIVFYVPGLDPSHLYLVFFLIGFCCGAHSLCFALGKETNPIQVSATSVAVTNMLIMTGGMIFQPLVGKLLVLHASNSLDAHGLPTYAAADYTFALSVIPIGVALGLILSIFLKETYCQSQASEENENLFKPELQVETVK